MHAFRKTKLGSFWLASGGPKFLSELVAGDWRVFKVFRADAFLSDELNEIDLVNKEPTALLFQSGCLTVGQREVVSGTLRYCQRLPNLEVEADIANQALGLEGPIASLPQMREKAKDLLVSLSGLDAPGAQIALEAILTRLPLLTRYLSEGHYRGILQKNTTAISRARETMSASWPW
ncbi:MAG: hypothetical protein LBU69_03085 [Deltaproteobacteria bacterium]|nr:hypothetical protein [Deltaproteobacteria bacterium]